MHTFEDQWWFVYGCCGSLELTFYFWFIQKHFIYFYLHIIFNANTRDSMYLHNLVIIIVAFMKTAPLARKMIELMWLHNHHTHAWRSIIVCYQEMISFSITSSILCHEGVNAFRWHLRWRAEQNHVPKSFFPCFLIFLKKHISKKINIA